jgi:hypothetical protein
MMRGPLPLLEGDDFSNWSAGEQVVVELGLLDLGSYATSVVPELGGEGLRNNRSLRSSKAPTRSTHTVVRDIR